MERDKSQLQAQKALNLVLKEQVGERGGEPFWGLRSGNPLDFRRLFLQGSFPVRHDCGRQ